MRKVVGIRFRNTGESQYYDPKDFELCVGDRIIVDGDLGEAMGTITTPIIEVEENRFEIQETIIRKATEEDIAVQENNEKDEKEAYIICKEKVAEHDLPMKLICAEYSFERNKLLFYFTAENRVDFRELVKDLAAIFHTRIELRQVGVRDETKFLGGIGICGRPFCCQTFLTEFAPVSIKMAKEQKLSLNPTKISGVCGRLMCCLKNEEETYEYLNQQLPNKGELVETLSGKSGTVYSINALKQKVNVLFEENDEKEIQEYAVDELIRKGRPHHNNEKDTEPEEVEDSMECAEEIQIESVEDSSDVDKSNKHFHRRNYRKKFKNHHKQENKNE